MTLLLFVAADVVFFVWVTHRVISFWSALVGALTGGFAIGVWWSFRPLKQQNEPTIAPAPGGRQPANLAWRCPACGVGGDGYVPEHLNMAFGCPVCGVQAEVTRKTVDVE